MKFLDLSASPRLKTEQFDPTRNQLIYHKIFFVYHQTDAADAHNLVKGAGGNPDREHVASDGGVQRVQPDAGPDHG